MQSRQGDFVTLSISQLQTRWNKEKQSYATQEVGSGSQLFVREVLECEDLFNLKAGNLSTPFEKRKNEFISEHKTKERRHADIVIFISSEVVIPVEIEKYQDIEAGKKQLLQYQTDLDKKYGILTDGYTWRFYNNNMYREVTLEEIVSQRDEFLEFWKSYIATDRYWGAPLCQDSF
jgi:hypothetical protein